MKIRFLETFTVNCQHGRNQEMYTSKLHQISVECNENVQVQKHTDSGSLSLSLCFSHTFALLHAHTRAHVRGLNVKLIKKDIS